MESLLGVHKQQVDVKKKKGETKENCESFLSALPSREGRGFNTLYTEHMKSATIFKNNVYRLLKIHCHCCVGCIAYMDISVCEYPVK